MIKNIFKLMLSGLFLLLSANLSASIVNIPTGMPIDIQICLANNNCSANGLGSLNSNKRTELVVLPDDIQRCVDDGSCNVNQQSMSEYNNVSMYEYIDLASNTTSKLIRYSLVDAYQVDQDVMTDFSGYVWLKASDSFSATESTHDLTLYLDQSSPARLDMTYGAMQNPDVIHLGLTAADLLAGTAFTTSIVSSDYPSGYFEDGDLLSDAIPPPCLADYCGVDAFLHLVYLQYVDEGSSYSLLPWLNESDSNEVLYSQRSYFDSGDVTSDYYQEQVFSVQAVPLPAATWLFMSGLLALTGFIKRKGR